MAVKIKKRGVVRAGAARSDATTRRSFLLASVLAAWGPLAPRPLSRHPPRESDAFSFAVLDVAMMVMN